jgi:K+-sensing histidine kinase KdpD
MLPPGNCDGNRLLPAALLRKTARLADRLKAPWYAV